MNKPISPIPKTKSANSNTAKRTTGKRAPKKPLKGLPSQPLNQKLLFIAIEALSILAIVIYGIILVLGSAANWFSGTSFLGSLLPFASGVMALILTASVFLITWWKLRNYLKNHSSILIPTSALILAWLVVLVTGQDNFSQSLSHFRTLVGGKEEASRVTLNHQVFAAYRRYNPANLNKMVSRAEPYRHAIAEAADEFDIDRNLLEGIAATESSFMPRDSFDGGHGLFQITAVPKKVVEEAKSHLGVEQLSLNHPKHNAFIAAATFKHYLAEMKNDVFLGLLAYNIGPSNGGLRFIMKKYGVTDFITIQPYLQLLPRDYPIRVLSYALAFRLWQKEGKLLAYEEGNNAIQIQRIGVPGLP
jgi:Transglycosylase SLT domain